MVQKYAKMRKVTMEQVDLRPKVVSPASGSWKASLVSVPCGTKNPGMANRANRGRGRLGPWNGASGGHGTLKIHSKGCP